MLNIHWSVYECHVLDPNVLILRFLDLILYDCVFEHAIRLFIVSLLISLCCIFMIDVLPFKLMTSDGSFFSYFSLSLDSERAKMK